MLEFATVCIAPPRRMGVDGKPRRVGVEIEFAGLASLDTANIVAHYLGGVVRQINPHRFEIQDTELGLFRAELDSRYAHPEQLLASDPEQAPWLTRLTEIVSESIGHIGSIVVPCEVVSSPVEIRQISRLDSLIQRLKSAGAQGTDKSVFYAFGLHINAGVPTTDPKWFVNIIRAQILLSPWLRKTMQIDTSRYLTGFARPFAPGFVQLILDPSYDPVRETLIDDYLRHEPSRDRELDLLPLFAWLDEERVRSKLPNEKINPRPAFHYRLPNAALERPVWSVALEWNRWCLIERLADSPALVDLADKYSALQSAGKLSGWAEFTGEWLVHTLHREATERASVDQQ